MAGVKKIIIINKDTILYTGLFVNAHVRTAINSRAIDPRVTHEDDRTSVRARPKGFPNVIFRR